MYMHMYRFGGYRVISYLRRTFLGLRRGFAQIELSQIYL